MSTVFHNILRAADKRYARRFAVLGAVFLAVLLGQIVGGKIYQRGSSVSWVLPLALLALLLALFAAFTLAPPNLPLFTDPNSGVRGIFRV